MRLLWPWRRPDPEPSSLVRKAEALQDDALSDDEVLQQAKDLLEEALAQLAELERRRRVQGLAGVD